MDGADAVLPVAPIQRGDHNRIRRDDRADSIDKGRRQALRLEDRVCHPRKLRESCEQAHPIAQRLLFRVAKQGS